MKRALNQSGRPIPVPCSSSSGQGLRDAQAVRRRLRFRLTEASYNRGVAFNAVVAGLCAPGGFIGVCHRAQDQGKG